MVNKKLIFFIVDGMGDDPKGDFLKNSNIPNLDRLAEIGKVGRVYTVRGQEPESDVVIVRLLGYNTTGKGYPGRGPLEAYGAGLIKPGETGYIAWRANFVTFEEKMPSVFDAEIQDSRVGRTLTNDHARVLADYINEKAKERYKKDGIEITISPTVEHRGVVVFKGDNLSSEISNLDPFYEREPDGTASAKKPEHPKIKRCYAFSDTDAAKYTAEIANDYINACYEWLKEVTIDEREKNGLKSANGILMRNAGSEIIDLEKALTLDWAACVGMPMEKGIAMAGGMDLTAFKYPPVELELARRVKNNPDVLYEHFFRNLETEIREYSIYLALMEGFKNQAFWLHSKPIDITGHDGSLENKRKMLEMIDETIFKQMVYMHDSRPGEFVFAITADHPTPWKLKRHTKDPVPLLIAGLGSDDVKEFSEEYCMASNRVLDGPELFAEGGPIMPSLFRSKTD